MLNRLYQRMMFLFCSCSLLPTCFAATPALNFNWYIKHDAAIDVSPYEFHNFNYQIKVDGKRLNAGLPLALGIEGGSIEIQSRTGGAVPKLSLVANQERLAKSIQLQQLKLNNELAKDNIAYYSVKSDTSLLTDIKAEQALEDEQYLLNVITKTSPVSSIKLIKLGYRAGEVIDAQLQFKHPFFNKRGISALKNKTFTAVKKKQTHQPLQAINYQETIIIDGVEYLIPLKAEVSVADASASIKTLTVSKHTANNLDISVGINTQLSGRYSIEATLYGHCSDAPETLIAFMQSQTTADFTQETQHQVTLNFDFNTPSQNCQPPYVLKHIYLTDLQQIKRVDNKNQFKI